VLVVPLVGAPRRVAESGEWQRLMDEHEIDLGLGRAGDCRSLTDCLLGQRRAVEGNKQLGEHGGASEVCAAHTCAADAKVHRRNPSRSR
jgi:hypothetical protein